RSIVGEWNSSLGRNMSNNLIVGYNESDESRKNISPPWFPEVEILNGGTNYTTFGFEPFTPANQLRYHSYQLQDNYTVYLPKHSLTFGVSVEKYHSTNVFFQGAQSIYVYSSLADFYTDANDYLVNPSRTVSPVRLRRFQVGYSNIPGQAEPVQPLDVLYSGVYAQDEWRPRSEEHTSELQSRFDLVCRLLLEKKKKIYNKQVHAQRLRGYASASRGVAGPCELDRPAACLLETRGFDLIRGSGVNGNCQI